VLPLFRRLFQGSGLTLALRRVACVISLLSTHCLPLPLSAIPAPDKTWMALA
jgi:hypothetical protein